jgi:predicted nucleotidyltransferase
LRLRDRDAIITRENLIFRVFGCSHPLDAFISDLEYAPSRLFRSYNPKAPRSDRNGHVFYKFYEDEGWKFLSENYPHYMIFHEMLQGKTMGVNQSNIFEVRKPDEVLQELAAKKQVDEPIGAMQIVLDNITQHAGLSTKDFGVFGSILHGFHHPKLSDIDLVVYGRAKAAKLRETLQELYRGKSSPFMNEFETDESVGGKYWRFRNLNPEEYVRHQRKKLIYALFNDEESRRIIKTEFEPVKDWTEIRGEYDSKTRIVQKGWVKMVANVTDDSDAFFIPSVYLIEPVETLNGPESADEAARIVSYMEEFRLQARRGEAVYVEGNLEEVAGGQKSFHQITLTHCPRYYEQVLKVHR